MKTISFGLVFLFLIMTPWAFADGDHQGGAASGGAVFQINRAEVALTVFPANFAEDGASEIRVHLKNPDSGSAILEARIYVKLELKKQGDMAAMKVSGASSLVDNSAGSMDLDFGEIPAVSSVDLSTFKELNPQEMAGSFAIAYSMPEAGNYRYTLAVQALDGQIFSEPLIYGGLLSYQPASKASWYRTIFGSAIIIVTALFALLVLSLRGSQGMKVGEPLNLLDVPWIRWFFRSRWYQPLFQIPTAIAFVVIIFIGLVDTQAGDRSIATLLTWTIWWAAIIFTFVLLGRVWCMMCPFGAAQDLVSRRFSLKRNFPKPLQNIWLSTILFMFLTWWDSYNGIVNNPRLTSWLLIGFTVVSILTALVYTRRTFCRYICPLGGLIGLYSMFSPLELRNRSIDVCRAHKEKGCMRGSKQGYPCPMFVTPMTLQRNNFCNLCGECIKSCTPDNIVLRFRSFAADLWVTSKGFLDEAYLAMLLVGLTILVTVEMVAPWHGWLDKIIKALPMAAMGVSSHGGQEKMAFTVLLVGGAIIAPSLLLLLVSLVVKGVTGVKEISVKRIFIQFAYMFIPVGLAMHLAHNVTHLLREGVQVIPALQRVILKYTSLDFGTPNWQVTPLAGMEAVFWFQMFTLIILNGFSLYAGYRIASNMFGDKALRAFIPMALLAVIFMLLNTYILGQPMALRHSH